MRNGVAALAKDEARLTSPYISIYAEHQFRDSHKEGVPSDLLVARCSDLCPSGASEHARPRLENATFGRMSDSRLVIDCSSHHH